jgi:hypothetical protein
MTDFRVTYYQYATYPETHWLVAIVTTVLSLCTKLELLLDWELE